nr:uncharacterized mitochondrial protein AtMg00810-like [Tanacetum cinerariifolium]
MSANDKFGLGYGDYRYGSILSYENEVLQSVFMNKASDLEDTSVNDRYAEGMHTVPPFMTGKYMPSGPDVEIDYSKFTYGPKQTSVDESDSKPSECASCESNSSVEITTSMPAPVENAPKDKEKPSFAFTDSVKHVKPSKENVKETGTPNHSPKIEKNDRNGHTRKGLGYALTKKACFVCGSFSHLIRDYDFHEKMAKQAELTKSKNKVTGQRENRPVWNNVQRVNHQNKFVPSVLTKTGCTWRNKRDSWNKIFNYNSGSKFRKSVKDPLDDLRRALKDKGIIASGCSRHMIGNKAHLADYQEFKGGSVTFGGSNGRITGKGKIRAGKLDFEDVYYVEELKHYNLFSMSHMCDKKNKVLFTDTDCLVLSLEFKLLDENQVLLKIHRQHNMYSFNLKNTDPSGDLAFLSAKASINESNKWHRRLGHVNFKNLNKLVKRNLVRCLPSKIFENDHTYIACQKGKQHKASCKAKTRKNKTLIEAARTMLADSFLPTTFWAEAVNTACYVLNRVLVTKPQNKTPYELLTVENQANKSASPKEANNSAATVKSSRDKVEKTIDFKTCEKPVSQVEQIFLEELEKLKRQEKKAHDAAESLRNEATHDYQNANTSSTNLLNTVSTPLSTAGHSRALNDGEPSYPVNPSMPHLEDIYASPREGIFTDSSYDDEGVVTDFNNLEITMSVSLTPTTIIHNIHPKTQILRDLMSAVQTRSKVNKNSEAHALVSYIEKQQRNNHKDFQHCLFACFLSQIEPKKISQALEDKNFPFGKKAIRTKWVYRNKKDKRGVVVRNKARSIIGSLMYLIASRPDIMFAVCACSRFQVTLKTSHLQAVKRIFRYLKGQPKLGLWYPKVSSFDLKAYSDSDYAGVNLDRKFTTKGCQFLGRRLISWQYKKQTIVATSTTEAEYVAAAHFCGFRINY